MAYAWRRSTKAMAVTSSTTAVAFLANAFSPLMPIRSFGIWSGVIVLINYLLVVTLLPPATIFYEKHIEYKYSPSCIIKMKEFSEVRADDKKVKNKDDPFADTEYTRTDNFFNTTWNFTINKYKWPILMLALIWAAFAIWKAS
jgi:predicted RND superfamily exporter protein